MARSRMSARLRGYFFAGLLVWLPIWATLLVLGFIVNILNSSLALLPMQYRPEILFGVHIPALGAIISILLVFTTGVFAKNFLGKYVLSLGEALVARIPLVRSIYAGVKQMLETLFTDRGQSFKKVLLVEYPRKGLWTLAFQTGQGSEEINASLREQDMVSLFIPTTPNPTSGFLMVTPRSNVIELNMNVDEALKFIVSLGVIQPQSHLA